MILNDAIDLKKLGTKKYKFRKKNENFNKNFNKNFNEKCVTTSCFKALI